MSTQTIEVPVPRLDLEPLTKTLWIAVIGVALADIVTTQIGLSMGATEANPVARGAIESLGVVGMVALKLFAIGVAVYCQHLLQSKYAPIVPTCLAVPWTLAVLINLSVIGGVL